MEETYLLNVEGVKKKILHGGCGGLPHFQDGSKVTFHFQTLKDNFERTVIDDSRRAGIPMEIIVGKMFKIEVWETLLTSMRIGEVAEYWCDAIHTGMYALVSKGMRRIAEGRDPLEGQKHRCGMGNLFDYHSTGYADLDELQREPQPLIFIMELFNVEDPSSYKRDTWAMSKDEKLLAVPRLHTEGNRLVLSRKFKEAAEKYQEAVVCLRHVQAKEKPQEEEWVQLENLITPLVLNYCQCQLELGEYYEVLEHTTDLLQKNSKNVKAYFKRAKAHAAIWNEKEAREDFMRVSYLDPSLAAAVRKELKLLGERMRQKQVEERKRYQGLFRQPLHKEETEQSRAVETGELPKGREPLPGCGLGRAEVEGNDPEATKPKKGGEIRAGDGEPEPGSVEEEKEGILVGQEMGNEDFASAEEIGMTAQVESEVRDQGTAPNHPARNGAEGERSCREQQPDGGQRGADREGGNAEDSCSQKDAASSARPKEDGERRTSCGGFEEAVGGAAGSAMISRGGRSVEGPWGPGQCPTTQDSSGKRDECEERGEVGTASGVLPRTQDQAARGLEDVAEGVRGESAGRGSEGGGIQPLCEGSGREAKGAAAGSDWGSPGGWREHASGGRDEMGDEMAGERGADDPPGPERLVCEQEAGPGPCEGSLGSGGAAAEPCARGWMDAKAEVCSRAGHSGGEKGEEGGCWSEETNEEPGAAPQGQSEYGETERHVRAESAEGENLDTEQTVLQVGCGAPGKERKDAELNKMKTPSETSRGKGEDPLDTLLSVQEVGNKDQRQLAGPATTGSERMGARCERTGHLH